MNVNERGANSQSTRQASVAIVRLTGVFALALTLLVACGDAGTEDDVNTEQDAGSADDAPTAGGESAPNRIAVGYTPAAPSAFIKIADQEGFFEKHGLEVEYGGGGSGAAQIAQLVNGELDVAFGGVTGAVTANAQGFPIMVVTASNTDEATDGAPQAQVLVPGDSDIEDFGDLEGRTVGLNSLQGTFELGIREGIDKAGGDAQNVNLVQIPFSSQLTAAEGGRVDAVSTIQPFVARFLSEGYRSIGGSVEMAVGDPAKSFSASTFMSSTFVEENPEAVESWVAALDEAAAFANDNPDEVKAIIIEDTGAPPEVIEAAPLPVYEALVDVEVLETWAELLAKYEIIDEVPSMDELLAPGAKRTGE